MSRAGVEANTAVKDAGKAERKPVAQKRAMTGKEKKTSIHERLEINKKIIQEKQGQDKMERGADGALANRCNGEQVRWCNGEMVR